MEEKESSGFHWSALFLVTSISTLVFSFVMKWADGAFSPILLLIGLASFGMAICSYAYKMLLRYNSRKKDQKKIYFDSY